MATLYPIGYGTRMVTMSQMRAEHENRMEPEFARRLFNWIASTDGTIGIGGGRRTVQPTKAGFAPPGKSFHQDQVFADNSVWYSAVDLVHVNPGGVHRAPTWSEVPRQGGAAAARFGVHCNVDQGATPEPWHMQAVEMDGFDSWATAGRRRPVPGYLIPAPGAPAPPPPPIIAPPTEDDVKFRAYYLLEPGPGVFATYDGLKCKTHIPNLAAWAQHRDQLVADGYQIPDGGQEFGLVRTSDVAGFQALGPIVGTVPAGLDPFGVPV